jgi:hypothetical protein
MFRCSHTIFRELIIRASTDNALPEDGVTASKHVVIILIQILILFLRQSIVHSLANK